MVGVGLLWEALMATSSRDMGNVTLLILNQLASIQQGYFIEPSEVVPQDAEELGIADDVLKRWYTLYHWWVTACDSSEHRSAYTEAANEIEALGPSGPQSALVLALNKADEAFAGQARLESIASAIWYLLLAEAASRLPSRFHYGSYAVGIYKGWVVAAVPDANEQADEAGDEQVDHGSNQVPNH